MQYFEHTTTAGSDSKIIALRLEHGGAAVDAYWVALEEIYHNEKPLVIKNNPLETKALAHRLNVSIDVLETWFSTMVQVGLFEVDAENPNAITSARAMNNIEAYQKKCETARQNGKLGGRKPSAKPRRNQAGKGVGTYAETNSQANKTKQNKGFGLYEINQKPIASDGAAAAKAAPPSADKKPYCPSCDVKIWKNTQSGKYDCPNCGNSIKPEAVVWQ